MPGDTVVVTIGTDPAGLTYTVDSVTYSTSVPFTWAVGSVHTISTTSPQGTGDTRFLWSGWSDGGTQTHEVTATANANLIADLRTQYYLTMANGGVTPPSGYYDAGTSLQISITYPPNCYFHHWDGGGNGSYSGTGNPATITMLGPIYEVSWGSCDPPPTSTPTATPAVTPSPVTRRFTT